MKPPFLKFNSDLVKNKNLNRFDIPDWLPLIIMLIFIFAASSQALAEKKKKSKKTKHINAEFSLETTYDDNILKYSKKYLERFMNREDEGRFHIKTYDDIILNPALELGTSLKIFKKRKTDFTFKYSYNWYMVNNVKDWSMFYAGVEQDLTKKASFKLLYIYIPEFYVRHFRDVDYVDIYGYTPQTFVPFSFSKDNFGFWIQNTFFKSTRLRFYLYYSRYYHNSHYTEYDSKNLSYRIQIFQDITKNLRFDFSYEFSTSDAKGYDEAGETKAFSDDADATNEGDDFNLGLLWRLPRIKKHYNSLSLDVTYAKKYYTTNHFVELDEEHAGRVDKNIDYGISYRIKINKSMYLSAFYKWYSRDSNTTSDINSEYVSNEKDYRQSRVGLEYTWKFNF